MSYREFFQKKHTLLAVVHVESVQQSLRNTAIAYENGADGVFLINHANSVWELLATYRRVREIHPNYFFGLNLLGMESWEMFGIVPVNVSGIWSDSVDIREGNPDPTEEAKRSWNIRKERSDWRGIYFGGVAFKYQETVSDPGRVAKLALPYVDVITTSGDGTGVPPSIGKIKKMRSAIGPDVPLAIASGMTPENVSGYLSSADCFLVATGISKSFIDLDPLRVAAFSDVLKESSKKGGMRGISHSTFE